MSTAGTTPTCVMSDGELWKRVKGWAPAFVRAADGSSLFAACLTAMPERPSETMLKRADREATEREVDLEAIVGRQLRELIAARWLLVSRKRSTVDASSPSEGSGPDKVFLAHYEPRLRDNEQRAVKGRTLRGRRPFLT